MCTAVSGNRPSHLPDDVEDLDLGDVPDRAHYSLGRLEREGPGEHTKATEDDRLGVVETVMAPVDGRCQGPVPGQHGSGRADSSALEGAREDGAPRRCMCNPNPSACRRSAKGQCARGSGMRQCPCALPAGDARGPSDHLLRAKMLGPFCISLGDQKAIWARPPAKRLCELVLLSPGRRISKDAVCEALYPGLAPLAAAKELSRALSMARASLAALGGTSSALLKSDRALIWADPGTTLEVDLELHEALLRSALEN